ncbi:MAG: F0F1 ATP synthase subunit alpha, partial [Candidatus Moranbacteria bacterium]|nr:F0F1 ATP synthase subunit alpha [Candidatus Moranbacteria bacterium]
NGFMDDVPVEKMKEWENDFHKFMKNQKVLKEIAEKKELTDEIIKKLEKSIGEFKEVYQSNN